MDRSIPSEIETTETKTDEDGKVRVTGTSSLKGTQAYPTKFGKAIADIFVNSRITQSQGPGVALRSLFDQLLDNSLDANDPWNDAELDTVLADIRNM